MAQTLNEMVRECATKKIASKLNLPQYKAEKEAALLHKHICEELVKLADEHGVGMSFLVYFAVNKEAHRPQNFAKGYKTFDKDKALAVIEMSKAFAAHHGMNKPSDKVYHAMCALYERCDMDNFNEVLASMTPRKKFATAKEIFEIMTKPNTVTVVGDVATAEVETVAAS